MGVGEGVGGGGWDFSPGRAGNPTVDSSHSEYHFHVNDKCGLRRQTLIPYYSAVDAHQGAI
jgi:hypothetical protein